MSTTPDWCISASDDDLTVHLAECENLVLDHEADDLRYALTEAKHAMLVLREMVKRRGGDPDCFISEVTP